MTHDEFRQYWEPARNTFGLPKPPGSQETGYEHPAYLLARAIGVSYRDLGHWKFIPLTDELKDLLKALAGPHRETMLKIHQIRKGLR